MTLRGLFLALVAVSIFGTVGYYAWWTGESQRKMQKDQFRYVQFIEVEGTCLEDHAKERWTRSYKGRLHLWYDAKVGRYGDGTIYNLGGLGGTINRDLFSEQYDPPFAIGFSNIPANVFAQGTMALKGLSNPVGSEPSHSTSCSLTVTERRGRK